MTVSIEIRGSNKKKSGSTRLQAKSLDRNYSGTAENLRVGIVSRESGIVPYMFHLSLT